ncbi:hypothetical protein AVXHC19_05950 [Acidovorax sacchari]
MRTSVGFGQVEMQANGQAGAQMREAARRCRPLGRCRHAAGGGEAASQYELLHRCIHQWMQRVVIRAQDEGAGHDRGPEEFLNAQDLLSRNVPVATSTSTPTRLQA